MFSHHSPANIAIGNGNIEACVTNNANTNKRSRKLLSGSERRRRKRKSSSSNHRDTKAEEGGSSEQRVRSNARENSPPEYVEHLESTAQRKRPKIDERVQTTVNENDPGDKSPVVQPTTRRNPQITRKRSAQEVAAVEPLVSFVGSVGHGLVTEDAGEPVGSFNGSGPKNGMSNEKDPIMIKQQIGSIGLDVERENGPVQQSSQTKITSDEKEGSAKPVNQHTRSIPHSAALKVNHQAKSNSACDKPAKDNFKSTITPHKLKQQAVNTGGKSSKLSLSRKRKQKRRESKEKLLEKANAEATAQRRKKYCPEDCADGVKRLENRFDACGSGESCSKNNNVLNDGKLNSGATGKVDQATKGTARKHIHRVAFCSEGEDLVKSRGNLKETGGTNMPDDLSNSAKSTVATDQQQLSSCHKLPDRSHHDHNMSSILECHVGENENPKPRVSKQFPPGVTGTERPHVDAQKSQQSLHNQPKCHVGDNANPESSAHERCLSSCGEKTQRTQYDDVQNAYTCNSEQHPPPHTIVAVNTNTNPGDQTSLGIEPNRTPADSTEHKMEISGKEENRSHTPMKEGQQLFSSKESKMQLQSHKRSLNDPVANSGGKKCSVGTKKSGFLDRTDIPKKKKETNRTLAKQLDGNVSSKKAGGKSSNALKRETPGKENKPRDANVICKDEAGNTSKKKQVTLTQGEFLENVKEEKCVNICKGEASSTSKKKQVTLTQGDFVEEVKEEKCVSNQPRPKSKDSVEIRKRGSLKETIVYSKGDVWQSSDPKYEGFAFTLGCFFVVNMEYEAEIAQIYLKLEKTYIGREQATNVIAERNGCDWVNVEKHDLIPKDRRVQLKTLCNKLAEFPQPKLHYEEDSPTFAYLTKCVDQFTPLPENQGKPIALDVFAGGGGMSVGLKRAGWKVKYKVEKDDACCKTLRNPENFPKSKVYKKDIKHFLLDLKSGKLKIDTKNITLIHGSPPCQGFSGANTSGGNNDHQNKECTIEFLEVVEYIQPPFVSMENVPGLAMKRKLNGAKDTNKSYLQKVMGRLISLGYDVSTTQTFASFYGDPQNRKRLVLFAAKQGYRLPSTPRQTHGDGEGMKPIVNVDDVLRDLETIEPNCSGRVTLKNNKTVGGHFIEGTARSISNDDDIRLYAKQPLAPAKTIRKKNKMCHYNQNRYLTLLEYKRLMSFPDAHILEGTRTEMRDQIGNAVPCKFAEAIGRSIMESYRMGNYTPASLIPKKKSFC